jgi:hypothetical protein
MKVSRRAIMKSTVLAGAATALPAMSAERAPMITVFDSRIPESVAFAKAAQIKIDVADLETTRWARLRAALPNATRVRGLTGWSDWTVARGLLEEQGLRLRQETAVAAPLSGKVHLFKWDMA